jgi:PAS domain S-box-containing protein
MSDHIEEYRVLCSAVPIGLWRTKLIDGEFLIANQECANILGYKSPDDLIGTQAKVMYVDGVREQLLKELNENKCIQEFEALITRADTTQIWVSINAKICEEKGYMEGSIQDITQDKILEERMGCIQEKEINKLKEIQVGIKKRLDDLSASMCERRR